jgi:hypothetical protein
MKNEIHTTPSSSAPGPPVPPSAAILAEYGHRVLVLEREKFPALPHRRIAAAVHLPAPATAGFD